MAGSPARKKRIAVAPESAFETSGTYVNPSGAHDITHNPGREMVERDEHLNSFGDRYAATPGVQAGQVGVVFDACQQTYANIKSLFTGALGEEDAGGALTLGGGTSNDSQVSISAGTPSKIIEVTANNGGAAVRFLVPVKSFGGAIAVYGIKLPAGYTTVTAVKNLSQLSGGVFNYLQGTAANTFSIEIDRSGDSRQIPYRYQGCAITQAMFRYERRQRLSFGFNFQASKWADNPGGLSTADATPMTNAFMSFAGDWRLQDLATPVAPVALTVKKVEFQFAPAMIPDLGSRGLDGSFVNLAGSDITGWTRGVYEARVKVTVATPAQAYHTELTSDTAKQLFGVMYPGKPGRAAATPRYAVWLSNLIHTGEPVPTEIDDQEAMELTYVIGRDPALSVPSIVMGLSVT